MQMPLGRTSWWVSIREVYLRNQTYGYGMDMAWTKPVGLQKSTGVVHSGLSNSLSAHHLVPDFICSSALFAVCALHPPRVNPTLHVSGHQGEFSTTEAAVNTTRVLWTEYNANMVCRPP